MIFAIITAEMTIKYTSSLANPWTTTSVSTTAGMRSLHTPPQQHRVRGTISQIQVAALVPDQSVV